MIPYALVRLERLIAKEGANQVTVVKILFSPLPLLLETDVVSITGRTQPRWCPGRTRRAILAIDS
jgi:hypothetical protein